MNILILEDDIFWQSKLQMMVAEYPSVISVKVAYSKSMATEILDNYVPDLVLSDIVLPDGIAFDLFMTQGRAYPVIFLTGYPDKEYFKITHNLPKTTFLVKPFHTLTLHSAIQQFVPVTSKEILSKGVMIPGRFRKKFFLKYEDILYIEAEHNYVHIYTITGQSHIIKCSLRTLLKDLDERFLQIHKSFVINTHYANRLDLSAQRVILRSKPVPVGRTFRHKLIDLFKQ